MARASLLFTPGPLTTRMETRCAMLEDWGSRDPAFIAMTAELRERLLDVAGARTSHVAIPLQGSGTFIVEAAIGTLVGPSDRLLVLVNGAYGDRMVEIARRLGRPVEMLRWPEDRPVGPEAVERALIENPAITHLALVHCETTSGLLNPVEAVAMIAGRYNKPLLLDAMSSFGALPLDLRETPVAAVLASSNKCLESVPGLAFALIEQSLIARAKGVAPSLSLDLFDQWQAFENNGQWRFTPPVQVVAALLEALRALEAEGGPPSRGRRYAANFRTLAHGMGRLGFRLFLDPSVQAPIIATFHMPEDRRFRFGAFYAALAARGLIIYPGKVTGAASFRIGCIGALEPADLERLVAAIAAVLREFGLAERAGAEPPHVATSGKDRR